MLIDAALEDAKRRGLPVPVKPLVRWNAAKRAFLMCRDLVDAIERNKTDQDGSVRRRWAELDAAMIYFVEGGLITQKRLKALDPHKFEHWELRATRPKPSLRVFGRFAKPDVFVGTHVEVRKFLGGKNTLEWELAKLKCEDIWNAAGLPDPFTDAPEFRYSEYITENASEKVNVS